MVAENNSHVLDLLPDYVLDVLPDEDFSQVTEHLESCSTCQAEYIQLQKVVDELPLALQQSEPPPRVKLSLMKTIHKHKLGPGNPDALSFWQQLRDILNKRLFVIGTALILILAITNGLLWSQNRRLVQSANEPWQVVTLLSAEASSGAVGALILDSRGESGTLLVDNLSALGTGYQYQVWLIRNDERVSAGVFSVNPHGYASLLIQASNPLRSYDSIGISVEPFGGSPGPTGARVLDGVFQH
jgi:anti-sigma-K factor RskA